MQGLNGNDLCYANLETVLFHLHHRRCLEDYDLRSGASSTGTMLVFMFVRMDGTKASYDSILRLYIDTEL